jgi:hypothetical protein
LPTGAAPWALITRVRIAGQQRAPLLRRQGRYDQARRLDEAMLMRRRELLGADHVSTLSSANNLVVDLAAGGAHVRGRRLAEHTLARRHREFGDSRWVPQRCHTVDQRLRHPGFRGHGNSPISILWTPTRLLMLERALSRLVLLARSNAAKDAPRSSCRATRSRCCAEQPAPEK